MPCAPWVCRRTLSGASGSASATTSTTTRSGSDPRPSTSTRVWSPRSSTAPGHEVLDRRRAVGGQDRRERGLHLGDPAGLPAQVAAVDPALAVRQDGTDRGVGVEPAEAGAVGQRQQGAGEPVPAEVGALPDLVGQRAGEGGDDRAAAHGAAGVAGAVRADEHHRAGVLVAPAERRAERVRGREEVLGGAPHPAHLRAPHGVDGQPGLLLVRRVRGGPVAGRGAPSRRTTRRSGRPRRRAPRTGAASPSASSPRVRGARRAATGTRRAPCRPAGRRGGGTRRSSARDRSGPPRDATRGHARPVPGGHGGCRRGPRHPPWPSSGCGGAASVSVRRVRGRRGCGGSGCR